MLSLKSDVAKRVEYLHERVAYVARLALNANQERIALELAEIRRDVSDLFELVRPPQQTCTIELPGGIVREFEPSREGDPRKKNDHD